MGIEELRRGHNQNILSFKEQIGQHETKIAEFSKRAESIQEELDNARTELASLKQQQCNAIAAGEDYFSIGNQVKEKLHDVEMFEGALSTIREMRAAEQAAIDELNKQINMCLIELDKLDAVELGNSYNKLAVQMAQVFKEYNELELRVAEKLPPSMAGTRDIQAAITTLGQVVKLRNAVFNCIGIPYTNLKKAFPVLPGEHVELSAEHEYYFLEKRDLVIE